MKHKNYFIFYGTIQGAQDRSCALAFHRPRAHARRIALARPNATPKDARRARPTKEPS